MRNSSQFVMQARNCQVWSTTTLHSRKSPQRLYGESRFHLYLYGVTFVLQTDHELLRYMDSAKYINVRLMRWVMFLQSYSFEVEANKGSENVRADYLSQVEE